MNKETDKQPTTGEDPWANRKAGNGNAIPLVFAAVTALLWMYTAWKTSQGFGSPLIWLAHGGPSELLILGVVSITSAFALSAWFMTKPGARMVLMVIAVLASAPMTAIFYGGAYRTITVRTVGFTSERLGPLVKALEGGRAAAATDADIIYALEGVQGVEKVRVFRGDGRLALVVPGVEGGVEKWVMYYSPENEEWKRYHTDRAGTEAEQRYLSAIEGLAAVEFLSNVNGKWRKKR